MVIVMYPLEAFSVKVREPEAVAERLVKNVYSVAGAKVVRHEITIAVDRIAPKAVPLAVLPLLFPLSSKQLHSALCARLI